MSLRYRIAVTILVLEAIMLVLVLINTLGYSREAATREIVRSEEAMLSVLAEIARQAFLTAEYDELQPFVEEVVDKSQVIQVRITDDQGRIVVSTQPGAVGRVVPEGDAPVDPASGWRSAEVSNAAGLLGTIAVRFSDDPLRTAREGARNRGAAVAVAGMAVIALVGVGSGFLLTRRLDGLIATSRRFAAGDHSARARTPGRDEIAEVGGAFDAMAERIESQFMEIQLRENRHRDLLEQMGDLIQSMTSAGRLLLVNRAWREALGWEDADLEKLRFADLLGDEAEAASLLREVRNSETAIRRQITLHGRANVEVTVDATLTPVHDGERVVSILAVMRDVSERVRLNRELEAKEEQLRQSQRMEALGRLAGGIAHDFNNILTVVLIEVDALISAMDESDPLRGSALEIEHSGKRAADLTRQLLAFGRRNAVKPEMLDLDESVLRLEPMLRRLIGENIELRVRANGDGAWIEIDEGHLHQVIVNLVVNARDAMPDGGSIDVETSRVLRRSFASGKREERWLARLVVRDTGTGMDADTRQRVFDPFFTTKEIGKGTGLGLSTVYGIVTQAGGELEVQSRPGRGSSFLLLLPEVEAPTVRATLPAPRRIVGAGARILLVEDDEAVRSAAGRVLAEAGYEVTEAALPELALSWIEDEARDFDLVLSDVLMPGMSGVQLVRKIRAARPEIRILFMSGYSDLESALIEEDLLLKPFQPEALLAEVRRILEGRAASERA